MSSWHQAGPPIGLWWWALEHRGHPAGYLRALIPGDFVSSGPLPRHLCNLEGRQHPTGPFRCLTCGEIPDVADLEAVERKTGRKDFLTGARRGHARQPRPTDPASCWLCSSRSAPAIEYVSFRNAVAKNRAVPAVETTMPVAVCSGCAAFIRR